MRLDSSQGNLVAFGKASKKATGCNLSLSGIEENGSIILLSHQYIITTVWKVIGSFTNFERYFIFKESFIVWMSRSTFELCLNEHDVYLHMKQESHTFHTVVHGVSVTSWKWRWIYIISLLYLQDEPMRHFLSFHLSYHLWSVTFSNICYITWLEMTIHRLNSRILTQLILIAPSTRRKQLCSKLLLDFDF